MGRVINKSFSRITSDIKKKVNKLRDFIDENQSIINGKWNKDQSKTFEKLPNKEYSLSEEISNLDEVEPPNDN